MRRHPVLAFAALALLSLLSGPSRCLTAAEPTPQPIGGGSLASAPPQEKDVVKLFSRLPRIEPESANRPLPSNDWWTSLLAEPFPGKLWAMPATVSADAAGVHVWYPQGWNAGGNELVQGTPLDLLTTEAKPFTSCSTVRWGDWHVQFRLRTADDKHCDVTVARGMPYVWLECPDVDLRLPLAAADDKKKGDKKKKPDAGDAETAQVEQLAPDALLLTRGERRFVVLAPTGARLTTADGVVTPVFAAGPRYLVIGLVPDAAQLALIRAHAFVIPRQTRFDWTYDPQAGEVATTWTTTADLLRGEERQALQGWLPHHWRSTRNDLRFSAGAEFASQRGRLRLAVGNRATIAWPFAGLLPALPAPATIAADAPRLNGMIQQWSDDRQGKYGDDTYWGAKDVLGLAEHLAMARALGHPAAQHLHDQLRACLSDWFTYTPGEKAHFFARYGAPWNGVVGFKTSYGSGAFTDNHFHYGYFTLAAALLARDDAEWAKAFGPLATLVAKQYANWDRDDRDFPLLRTFDPWIGHSYAGGASSKDDGNNQESTSEAMQSWAGEFLLGAALGDRAMRDCGAMGWAIEAEAVREYWNDVAHENFPPQYRAKNTIVSVLRDRDMGFWTWFSGQPMHVYGIQWLPQWTSLQYLAKDPAFTVSQVDAMLARQGKGTPVAFTALGDDWGNIALGALLFGDAERVVRTLDAAAQANDPLAGWKRSTVTTYLAHGYRALGQVAWDCHATLPTSTVFRLDGRLVLAAWNPASAPAAVEVRQGAKVVGRATIAPGALVAVVLDGQAPPLPAAK